MGAGRRHELVTFQRATPDQDGAGQETLVWADLCDEWAAVFFGKGDERRQAAMEQAAQPATFQVLGNLVTRGVGMKDRIVWDGSTWNITGKAPMKPGEIEFTATRAL